MVGRMTRWTAALALVGAIAGCDDATDARFGSVSILLTDAPGEVVEAWVTITDIYLQGRGGEDDPPGGRVYLMQGGDETHELLSLSNSVAELVSGQEVPTGHYGQLRVVLSGGCIVTAGGEVYASSTGYDLCGARTGTLHMPSFGQSGAKVLLHGLQVTSGEQAILLDFDVSQSFGHQAGASGMWVMNPVIHGAEVTLTSGVAVTLGAGEVTLPEGFGLGDFSATLTPAEGDTSRLAFGLVDGVYRANFRYLIPTNGPFQVRLNVPTGLSAEVTPASPQSVSPASGETATVNWVLQSATATGS
jgi:hypothetical protein